MIIVCLKKLTFDLSHDFTATAQENSHFNEAEAFHSVDSAPPANNNTRGRVNRSESNVALGGSTYLEIPDYLTQRLTRLT